MALVVENLPDNAGDVGSIPGLGRSPEREHGNPLNRHEFEQTPRNSEGQGGLMCCSPWGHKESDMT